MGSAVGIAIERIKPGQPQQNGRREQARQAQALKCLAELYPASMWRHAGLPDLAYPLHSRDVLVTACGRIQTHAHDRASRRRGGTRCLGLRRSSRLSPACLSVSAAVSFALFTQLVFVQAGGPQFRTFLSRHSMQARLTIPPTISLASFPQLSLVLAGEPQFLALWVLGHRRYGPNKKSYCSCESEHVHAHWTGPPSRSPHWRWRLQNQA